MVKGSAAYGTAKPGSRIGMVKSNYAGAICSLFDLIQGSPWVWLIFVLTITHYQFDGECMYEDGNIPRDKNLQAH